MADHPGAGKSCRSFPLPKHPLPFASAPVSWSILGRLACLPLVAQLCLVLPGCGGDETPPPHANATPQPTPPPVATPPAVEEKKEEEKPAEEPKKEDEPEQPKEVAKEPSEPVGRPTDVSKWKKDDYLSAKKDGDRKLDEATQFMAEKFQKDARAAELFKELLEVEHLPAVKNPDGSPGAPKELAVNAAIGVTLLRGLAMNRTPEATAILKDVMFGKLETPVNSRVALNTIIGEMAKYSDYQEYQDFLFDLLTQPKKTLGGVELVPDAPLTDQQLRTLILGFVDAASTPQLNVRLAKHLEDPQVTKALATDIETSLIRDKPDTLTAKLILYQNEQAEKRTTVAAENAILSHSDVALSILLGLPPKLEELPPLGTFSRPTARQKGLDEDVIASEMDFAQQCWTPKLQSFLMQLIKKKGELRDAANPLQIIGSTPTQLARSNLSELIAENAYQGPTAWTSTGLFGRTTCDPAFVIMAKNVYHNPSRRPGRNSPDKETQEKWRDAMEPMIQGWFKRFYSAAQNSTSEDWSAAKETGTFKISFHRDAKVVTEYHLVWPGKAQALVPDVPLAGLEIHYVRLEDDAVPDKIISHYKRYGATGPFAPKRTIRNGEWYDDLDNGSTPKSKRSTDIYISHKPLPEEKPTKGVVQEQKPVPIAIDILTIEIPDPAAK